MKRYFITGVAGFIAARVAEFLLREGHTVDGVDNLSNYYNPALKAKRLETLLRFDGFRFTRADIEDCGTMWDAAGKSYDAVIHLAARAGVRPSVQDPASYIRTNLIGTLNVLDMVRGLGIGKLVVASSSSVYGSSTATPFREDQKTENPLSPYAASKKAAELLCSTYHHLYGMDISVLRFFTVYGPAGRPDMSMFRFVRAIVEGEPLCVYGDGTQLRDFSFVDDISRGVIASLRPCGFRVFNLGADNPAQISMVIKSIEKAAGNAAVIRYEPADISDAPATWANVSRARAELGWRPQVELEEGIRRTLRWYLDNRAWAKRMVGPQSSVTLSLRAAV